MCLVVLLFIYLIAASFLFYKSFRYYGAKSSSQCRLQEDQLCAFPQRTTAKGTAYAGQENMFLGRSKMGFCAVHRRVIYKSEGRLLIWREQRISQSNKRHSYKYKMCSMEEP
ncbi:hypothetical protein TNCV_4153921 [Trichonephila clavipes]|nr:hypothetical protein TNCV_4153921 [Trichonephila clavipes]